MAPWDLHFTLGFALVTDIATDGHEAMNPFESLHKGFAAEFRRYSSVKFRISSAGFDSKCVVQVKGDESKQC